MVHASGRRVGSRVWGIVGSCGLGCGVSDVDLRVTWFMVNKSAGVHCYLESQRLPPCSFLP